MSQPSVVSGVDTGILLEAGTNESEILVFFIGENRFGVNVAKVREVLPIASVTSMPKSADTVDGLVEIRETVVPLVNLEKYLYGTHTPPEQNEVDSLVLLEFNGQHTAFRVRRVERIYRISGRDTLPAPQLGDDVSPVTSIVRLEDGLIPLLDFESITAVIGLCGRNLDAEANVAADDITRRANLPIVFADDSRMIGAMVHDSLSAAGFTNLRGFVDGQEAWNYLHELTQADDPDHFSEQVACIVTDIEMPRLDGLSLTKKIRRDPIMANIPVILFSSIASKDNENKGRQVNATAQVSKPNYANLVATVCKVLGQ